MTTGVKQTVSQPQHGGPPQSLHEESTAARDDGSQLSLGGLFGSTDAGAHARSGFLEHGAGIRPGLASQEPGANSPQGLAKGILRLLQTPLLVKLVGANVLLLVVAGITALAVHRSELSAGPVLTVVIVAYLAALLLNTALVILAVQPLRILERTVDTIWQGNLDARVPASLLADRHVTRVARMVNILLDRLVADREHSRRLASEIIGAGDRERAVISRELHDSVAQTLAALSMQLGAAARSIEGQPDIVLERIEAARTLADNTLEEIRTLAHDMHPRVLDDLGLVAALRRLAREATDHPAISPAAGNPDAIAVDVVAEDDGEKVLSASVKSVLYRVAQEAVLNARRHAAPKRVKIQLVISAQSVLLQVTDDGRGMDLRAMGPDHAGIGLFTMRERVALVDGEFHVNARPGGGTSVVASIPLRVAALSNAYGAHT